jgi:L-lactate dehydrogenase complex protein LldF
VKIDIHVQLYKWRQIISKENALPASKRWSMKLLSQVLSHPGLYNVGGKLARFALRWLPHGLTHNVKLNPWAKSRELPKPPQESFKSWYHQNKEK